MSAVHYVVRNDDDAQLTDLGEKQPAWHWRFHGDDLTRMLCRINSRSEAERLAAEHGGTVHRITVTDEAVGLRWEGEPHWDDCGDEFLLLDGESRRVLARVEPSHDDRWVWFVSPGGQKTFEVLRTATLDEAKAAAEASVRGSWS